MSDLNRLQPPAFHEVENINLAQATKLSLANGIPVYLLDAERRKLHALNLFSVREFVIRMLRCFFGCE